MYDLFEKYYYLIMRNMKNQIIIYWNQRDTTTLWSTKLCVSSKNEAFNMFAFNY